jgi:CheY-like chemotaxis protein
VAITAGDADRELAQEAGFDRHLVKPVNPELLLQLIAHLPAGTPPAGAAPAGNGRGEEAERVLLVDDNADVRASIADMLRDAGYDVQAVPDGRAAIDFAESWRPRYVLADIIMRS